MLRIHFDTADFGRTRFLPEPAPLVELKLALMMLARPQSDPALQRWRRTTRHALPGSTLPLWDLITPFSGPAFLDPPLADLDEALDHVATTPHELVRSGVASVYAHRNSPVPRWLEDLAREDRAARTALTRALRSAYRTVVGPRWDAVRTRHHVEFASRSRELAGMGLAQALTRIGPGARWDAQVLEVVAPYRREVRLAGRGVNMLPSAHWIGPPLVADLPGEPVLFVYGCGGGITGAEKASRNGSCKDAPEGGHGGVDGLAGLLGRTRADVLRELSEPGTTGEIAHRLKLSAASASEHIRALRMAKLVTSQRHGQFVRHELTAPGRTLLDVNAGTDTDTDTTTGLGNRVR